MKRIGRLSGLAILSAGLAAGAAAAQEPPGGRAGPMEHMMDGPMGPMGPGGGWAVIDFAAIDGDGNGSLSRAELQARAVERLGKADTNADGALDREELVLALGGQRSAFAHVFSADPAEARADRLLALVGATETGRIEIAVLGDRRVNLLLASADTDRDAAISRSEADALSARADRHGRHHHRGADRGREGPRGGRGDR